MTERESAHPSFQQDQQLITNGVASVTLNSSATGSAGSGDTSEAQQVERKNPGDEKTGSGMKQIVNTVGLKIRLGGAEVCVTVSLKDWKLSGFLLQTWFSRCRVASF